MVEGTTQKTSGTSEDQGVEDVILRINHLHVGQRDGASDDQVVEGITQKTSGTSERSGGGRCDQEAPLAPIRAKCLKIRRLVMEGAIQRINWHQF